MHNTVHMAKSHGTLMCKVHPETQRNFYIPIAKLKCS